MRRTRITREGWCYLVLLAFIVGGAMIREINLLLVVAGIMAGPFLLGWRLLRKMLSRVAVLRRLPRGVGAGELFQVQLKVTNEHRRLGVWGLAVDSDVHKKQPHDATTTQTTRMFFPFVAAGQEVEQTFDCRLHDRGAYEFGSVRVASRFPLGLLKHSLVVDAPATVYVYPRLGRVRRKWLETITPSQLGSQRSQHRAGLTEGEFHSLRDWRTSDSRRWIHWRTSARRNQLTVRQFERRRNRNMAILLDLQGDQGSTEDIERAVRFVATVITHHCRSGSSHLLLGIAGQTVEIVSGHSSMGLMRDCMERLATAVAGEEDNLPALVDQAINQVDLQTRVALVSTREVDLRDTSRFSSAWDKPHRRGLLTRVVCLRSNAEGLVPFFEETDQIADERSSVP